MKDLKHAGFHSRKIKQILEQGKIEKIKPGLYRLSNMYNIGDVPQSFIDVCTSMQKGVICLISALEFHQLSTINPSEIYLALPNSDKQNNINFPPVKVFYFRKRFYEPGIEVKITKSGTFKIYNTEKTICDMFRYRNKLGEDLALEGLKNYLKRKDANLSKLRDFAITCQVKTVMLPYLKAMVVE